jgi:beta-mannosidase
MTDAEPIAGRPLWRRVAADWQLARLDRGDAAPGGWVPATVPGAVQLDWARAHGLPDPNFGDNVLAYDGLEDFHWLYRTRVPKVALGGGEQLVFACGGVDYACEVRLGGRNVLSHEGLFSGFELDLSGCKEGTELDVLVLPAPKRAGAPPDRSQASLSCKPAVSYGWDWHPRLIPLGLWSPAGFVVRPRAHLRHVDFGYALSEDLSRADITVRVDAPGGAQATWQLFDAAGARVAAGPSPRSSLSKPGLWWTHDHGEPTLYTLEVKLADGDVYRRRVGFRRVRLVMAEGAWSEPQVFPASRSLPPVTVELNGRVIFAKGSNWVCADIFPARVTADCVRPLLRLAREANLNMLRSWGGAIVNPEAFFDQCDELGLLVWQEFPLACNNYPDDPAYLRVLDQESRSIIRRVRQHPCLGLWGGGNELFNFWSGMTDQSLAIRLLNRNCYDLDPTTPFLPTAPIEGMGHGDYRFRDNKGREVYEIFQTARNSAYSEFGCPAPSAADYLRTFIPEAELWPPRAGTSWQTHHGFGAWEADPGSWLLPATLEHYFGPARSLEEMAERGDWLQCAGYQAIFEEARRQKPRCSMALNWCFNEPWPTAAGNAIINWPARMRPAYRAVQAACRPVLASARFAKFQWKAGEDFSAEIWMLNDAPSDIPAGEVEVALSSGGMSERLTLWSHPAIPAGRNLAGPRILVVLPQSGAAEFELVLKAGPGNCWGSVYRLSLVRGV